MLISVSTSAEYDSKSIYLSGNGTAIENVRAADFAIEFGVYIEGFIIRRLVKI